MRRRLAPGGDLVYLSPRKLQRLAIDLGVRTGFFDGGVELGGEAGVDVGVIAAKGSARASYVDPAAAERARSRQLEAVVRKLGGERLPRLERGDPGIREESWFRFHRALRFGVGHADSMPEHRALVMVDEVELERTDPTPRLLLNGAVAHVLDPYATVEERDAPGSRSGSSSDHLFIWLDEARRALEDDPDTDLRGLGSEVFGADRPPRDTRTAMEMYGALSYRAAIPPLSPRLDHIGVCEGVAQVSFVAADESRTLVMGSPLFVRRRALVEGGRHWWNRSR